MAGEFDGAGLMYIDVTGGGTDDAFKAFKQGIDHKGICLCTAGKKADVGFRCIAEAADLFLGALTDFIAAIACIFFALGAGKGG